MIRQAVRMNLYPGFEEVYKKRHDDLWPEMKDMLREYGVIKYYIFLDPEDKHLFGFLEIEDEEKWSKSSTTEINKKWWDFMADVMETNEDNSPVSVTLEKVFELN